MGSDISRGQISEEFLSEFPVAYKFLKKVNDSVYGDGDIYIRRGDADIRVFSQQVMYNPEYRWKPTTVKHPNVISYIAVLRHDDEVMCGDGSYLTVFYPYYERSLEQEIRNRDNKPFSEAQVWFIFNALINANAALAKQSKYCSDIRPINIRFKPDGNACILPYGSLPKDLTGYQKALNLGQLTYLAPEQLEKLSIKAVQPEIDQIQADVFSLGITLLVALSFQPIKSFYNFQKIEIRQSKIKKTLEELSLMQYKIIQIKNQKQRYSEELMRVLASTLHKNLEQRSTFEQLETLLEPYQKQIKSLNEFNITVSEIKQQLNQNDIQTQLNDNISSVVPQLVTVRTQIGQPMGYLIQGTQTQQKIIQQPKYNIASQYQPYKPDLQLVQSQQQPILIQQQYIQNTPAFKQQDTNIQTQVNPWGAVAQASSFTQSSVSSVGSLLRGGPIGN